MHGWTSLAHARPRRARPPARRPAQHAILPCAPRASVPSDCRSRREASTRLNTSSRSWRTWRSTYSASTATLRVVQLVVRRRGDRICATKSRWLPCCVLGLVQQVVVVQRLAHRRVEQLLLQPGMDGQLHADLLGQRAPLQGGRRAAHQFAIGLEQRVHGEVVRVQQVDGVGRLFFLVNCCRSVWRSGFMAFHSCRATLEARTPVRCQLRTALL